MTVAEARLPGIDLGALARRIGVRGRILAAFLVLLVLAVLAALLLTSQVLRNRLDREVELSLEQETQEVLQLAGGRNPETGEPFDGDAAAIFTTFLRRNIPSENETYLTFVGGEYFRGSRGLLDVKGFEHAGVEWANLPAPRRGELKTAIGPVRYSAVPIGEGDMRGTFVVAIALKPQLDDISEMLRTESLVWATVLLASVGVGWLIAGRVLAPLRVVTETANAITDVDLSRRIEVRSSGELAELASTINGMLDRIEEAFTAQRTFVDTTSHELRTPLTVIRTNLDVMGDDPEEHREALELVAAEVDRMSRIVTDLLELARAETPDYAHPEPFDVEAFTSDLAARARGLGGHDWRVEATAHGVVVADRQRLTQAVMILADNAGRYSDVDTPILIGTAVTDGRLSIWVTDFGNGIPEDQQSRIFDAYARADTKGSRGDGMGLGLAIARAIARAHDGEIHVRSTEGEGATFTIEIPAAPASPRHPKGRGVSGTGSTGPVGVS